jgi:DNA-binding CsgD family transcriptional regulator/predicted enzyme related to lactoylglutathione lyase
MTNREIAERRGISIETIKFHVANALAKLQVADRKALRQWFRVPKHSALSSKENSVADSLQLGPIGQISRTVRNVEEAQSWYGKVLGIPHLFTFGKLAFFDCGGTRLMLTQEERPSSAESVIYLRVADIVKAHESLRSRGVEFTNPPHLIHKHADGVEEWMAFFKDPEGRPLGIMSQVKP